MLISTLDKVIYYKGTFLQDSTNLSLLHKIGWRPAEKKFAIFFNECHLVLRFLRSSLFQNSISLTAVALKNFPPDTHRYLQVFGSTSHEQCDLRGLGYKSWIFQRKYLKNHNIGPWSRAPFSLMRFALRRYDFSVQRAILNFTTGPRGQLGPQGWNLSPRGNVYPVFHLQGGTLSTVYKNGWGTEKFTPGDKFTHRGLNSPLGDNFTPGGQSLPLGAKLRKGLRIGMKSKCHWRIKHHLWGAAVAQR
jgi:hypothetical protein